jgi:hypothetical protein
VVGNAADEDQRIKSGIQPAKAGFVACSRELQLDGQPYTEPVLYLHKQLRRTRPALDLT